jgi:hypothetical protein
MFAGGPGGAISQAETLSGYVREMTIFVREWPFVCALYLLIQPGYAP